MPADLLMAVAFRESNWNAAAVSRSGAMGIGQLMPDDRDVRLDPTAAPARGR